MHISGKNKTGTAEGFSRKLFVFLPRLTGSDAAETMRRRQEAM